MPGIESGGAVSGHGNADISPVVHARADHLVAEVFMQRNLYRRVFEFELAKALRKIPNDSRGVGVKAHGSTDGAVDLASLFCKVTEIIFLLCPPLEDVLTSIRQLNPAARPHHQRDTQRILQFSQTSAQGRSREVLPVRGASDGSLLRYRNEETDAIQIDSRLVRG